MKRWLAKLVVFLVLGAVVNVAVAWILAVTVNSFEGTRVRGYRWSSDEQWDASTWRRGGALTVYSARIWVEGFRAAPGLGPDPNDFVPSWTGLHQPTARVQRREGVEVREVDARGWPILTLSSEIEHRAYLDSLVTDGIKTTLLPWPRGGARLPKVLPLRPIWRGFAINTFFYAAIVWVLWSSPLAARRVSRRKRGRCIQCGYDLRGAEHEVCPECGVAGGPAAGAIG